MQNGSSQLAAYDEFRGQLAELRQHNESVVFDYEDPAGNKEARSHIHKLRLTKGAVERVRKAEKATYLELGRQVDAQAKEIVAEIESMIEVHQKPLDEIERREKERQAAHEARIARMQELAMESNEDITAAALRDRLKDLESYKLGEHWEEFEIEAARVKEAGIESLRRQIERREKYEAEQAELARLRREKEERERQEREAQIAREAEERARREAEERAQREREEAERKAQAEREAAERREQELRFAAEKAEREKAEAELRAQRAAEEAKAQAEREAKEKTEREAAEAKRREENHRHKAKIHRQAAAGFMDAGFTEEQAKQAVALIAKGLIQNVRISY